MTNYILLVWDKLRSSYWFVPSIFICLAIALSYVLPLLDTIVSHQNFPDWIATTTNSARTTLSTIAGAMVAVIGTVFSITVVTLSLTSQQFGPRLLRSFMFDLTTQLTIGVFLSTALYSILILRIFEKPSEASAGPPHFAVLFAVLLMAGSAGLLILYIHHIAVSIQAPRIVEHVSDELRNSIERLFPEKIGEGSHDSTQRNIEAENALSSLESVYVYSHKEGYIQAFDADRLLPFAGELNIVIRFFYRPGDFVSRGSTLAEVYGTSEGDSLAAKLNDVMIVGMRRTPRQDLECTVNELVEVAVRALSPGINDPFTAISCVDRLGANLQELALREIPSGYRYDKMGRLRLILKVISFPAVVDAAFNQIRQYGRDSVSVTIRLIETLHKISAVTHQSLYKDAVAQHAMKLQRVAERFPERDDRDDAMRRIERLMEQLSSESPHRFDWRRGQRGERSVAISSGIGDNADAEA